MLKLGDYSDVNKMLDHIRGMTAGELRAEIIHLSKKVGREKAEIATMQNLLDFIGATTDDDDETQ